MSGWYPESTTPSGDWLCRTCNFANSRASHFCARCLESKNCRARVDDEEEFPVNCEAARPVSAKATTQREWRRDLNSVIVNERRVIFSSTSTLQLHNIPPVASRRRCDETTAAVSKKKKRSYDEFLENWVEENRCNPCFLDELEDLMVNRRESRQRELMGPVQAISNWRENSQLLSRDERRKKASHWEEEEAELDPPFRYGHENKELTRRYEHSPHKRHNEPRHGKLNRSTKDFYSMPHGANAYYEPAKLNRDDRHSVKSERSRQQEEGRADQNRDREVLGKPRDDNVRRSMSQRDRDEEVTEKYDRYQHRRQRKGREDCSSELKIPFESSESKKRHKSKDQLERGERKDKTGGSTQRWQQKSHQYEGSNCSFANRMNKSVYGNDEASPEQEKVDRHKPQEDKKQEGPTKEGSAEKITRKSLDEQQDLTNSVRWDKQESREASRERGNGDSSTSRLHNIQKLFDDRLNRIMEEPTCWERRERSQPDERRGRKAKEVSVNRVYTSEKKEISDRDKIYGQHLDDEKGKRGQKRPTTRRNISPAEKIVCLDEETNRQGHHAPRYSGSVKKKRYENGVLVLTLDDE